MSQSRYIKKIIKEEFADVIYNYSTLLEQGPAVQPGAGASVANIMKQFPLKTGSKGELVKKIQSAVGTKADGDFGPNTAKAVKAKIGKEQVSIDDYKKLVPGDKSVAKAGGGAVSFSEDEMADAKEIRDMLLNIERTLDTQVKKSLGASSVFSMGKTKDRAKTKMGTGIVRESKQTRIRKIRAYKAARQQLWEGIDPWNELRDISSGESRRLFGTKSSQVDYQLQEGIFQDTMDFFKDMGSGGSWNKARKRAAEKVEPLIGQVGSLARRYARSPEASRKLAGAYYQTAKQAGSKGTGLSLAAVLMSASTMGASIGLAKATGPLRQLADTVISGGSPEEQAFQKGKVEKRVQKSKALIDLWTKEGAQKKKDKADRKSSREAEHGSKKQWDKLDDAAESAAKKIAKAITTVGFSGGKKSGKGAIEKGMDFVKGLNPFSEGLELGFDTWALLEQAEALNEVTNFDEDKIEKAISTYVKKAKRIGVMGKKSKKSITDWNNDYTVKSLLDYHIGQIVDGYDKWYDIYKDDKGDLKTAHRLLQQAD